VSFARVLGYFLRLGTTGFGGRIATIGYMQRDLVERSRWMAREDFLTGCFSRPTNTVIGRRLLLDLDIGSFARTTRLTTAETIALTFTPGRTAIHPLPGSWYAPTMIFTTG
jgi:hypothetical protein